MTKIFTPFLLFIALACQVFAQSSQLPIHSREEEIVERLQILYGGNDDLHLSLKGFYRKDAVETALKADSLGVLSPLDKFDLRDIYRNNNEWTIGKKGNNRNSVTESVARIDTAASSPNATFYSYEKEKTTTAGGSESNLYEEREKPVLGYFYKTPANLWEYDRKDFYVRLNPILNFSVGKDLQNKNLVISNTRGFTLHGGLDERIYFHTELLENQESYPKYLTEYVQKFNSVPQAGFYKSYTSRVSNKFQGYDYFRATGYLGVHISKHVSVQLGHGPNFIGDGYRSLFLSDFAPNYLYLKLNTRFWKLHYQNIFAELGVNPANSSGDRLGDKKYFAAHYLSANLTKNISVGIFETVIFGRKNYFELQYLNPLIIYRAVEHSIGSPDNVMLGANARWNFLNHFSVYSQFLLDEFVAKELFGSGRGWWGNKYGIQAGIKYFNAFGVEHLDLQAEYNQVRPYTYTHGDSVGNFTHNNLPLAHPLGANFKEFIFKVNYAPTAKILFRAQVMNYKFGDDFSATDNNGGNITKTYETRNADYGNFIGQGNLKNVTSVQADASYEFYQNYHLYLQVQLRTDKLNTADKTTYVGGGVRINFLPRMRDF